RRSRPGSPDSRFGHIGSNGLAGIQRIGADRLGVAGHTLNPGGYPLNPRGQIRPPCGRVVARLHLDRTDAMLALLVVIWGTAFPGIKVLGEVLDPYQMTWFRYALFPVAYGAWMVLRRREVFRRVSGGDWLAMGLLGIVGVIGYHFSLNWGMHGDDGVTAATG